MSNGSPILNLYIYTIYRDRKGTFEFISTDQ
jgi:hypothetical protein